MGVPEVDPLSQLSLPPGFRFFPTDEELLVQYLCRKVAGHHFSLQIIGEIDLYKFDAWDLPGKAIFGEKEWYFFSPRDRKYPNGSRPNRVAGSGYWKATGTDKIITTEGRKVGIKKALVFYVGKAPKGTKTNWIMHEYRLSDPPRKNGSARLDEWVLCRIYKKNSSSQKPNLCVARTEHSHSHGSSSSSSSQFDDVLESLPEIDEPFFALPRMNSLKNSHQDEKINLQHLGSGNFDWATLAGFSSIPEPGPGSQEQAQSQAQVAGRVNFGDNPAQIYTPLVTPQFNHLESQFGMVDEEVESGIRTLRVGNPSFVQQNPNALNYSHPNHVDPFGIRYSTQLGGLGFRQ